jgi:hypothetical protein
MYAGYSNLNLDQKVARLAFRTQPSRWRHPWQPINVVSTSMPFDSIFRRSTGPTIFYFLRWQQPSIKCVTGSTLDFVSLIIWADDKEDGAGTTVMIPSDRARSRSISNRNRPKKQHSSSTCSFLENSSLCVYSGKPISLAVWRLQILYIREIKASARTRGVYIDAGTQHTYIAPRLCVYTARESRKEQHAFCLLSRRKWLFSSLSQAIGGEWKAAGYRPTSQSRSDYYGNSLCTSIYRCRARI